MILEVESDFPDSIVSLKYLMPGIPAEQSIRVRQKAVLILLCKLGKVLRRHRVLGLFFLAFVFFPFGTRTTRPQVTRLGLVQLWLMTNLAHGKAGCHMLFFWRLFLQRRGVVRERRRVLRS